VNEPVRRIFKRKTVRRVLLLTLALLLLPPSAAAAARAYTALQARGRIYTLANAPSRPVAIIFGAEIYRNGTPSPMLADRIRAGVELYNAGKVRALLLTGDNSEASYNEPEAMRRFALSLGVPDSALVLDYAGFRTYDSCYRARDIFKVESAILVTQAFHLDRALFTCAGLGIDAVGVAADAIRPTGYSSASLRYSIIREFPSTMFAMFDVILQHKPYYLGDPLPIFGS